MVSNYRDFEHWYSAFVVAAGLVNPALEPKDGNSLGKAGTVQQAAMTPHRMVVTAGGNVGHSRHRIVQCTR